MKEVKKRGRKKKSLYECVRTFLDQMNRRYPDGSDSDGSTVFIIASDGKKISSLFGGDDDTMAAMISYVTFNDDEVKTVVANGLLSTVTLLQSVNDGTIASA